MPRRFQSVSERPRRQGGGAARSPHLLGHDTHLGDPRTLRGIDHLDDLAIPKITGTSDEHRLLSTLLEDVAQALLELLNGHRLLIDRNHPVGRVLQHDLTRIGGRLLGTLGLERQIDIETPL